MKAHVSLVSGLALDRATSLSLHRQLADGLREAILRDKLPTGSQLPSTRKLATDLGLGRNTVISAYEQLVSEGFLVARTGDGTRVAAVTPHQLTPKRRRETTASKNRPQRTLSRIGTLLDTADQRFERSNNAAFTTGLPALDAFPNKLWARLVGRAIRQAPLTALGPQEPGGYSPLKQTIAAHLKLTRGVECRPEQILILPGAQAALDITARLLLDPGDEAWIEDPCYLGARGALKAAGARLRAIPVDDQGMNPTTAIGRSESSRQPGLIYVTPSYQFPLGVTMTLERRLALLEFARRHNTWILEDDYDSDFRYQGRPLAALQGLDTDGRVIYAGTFSKTMFPSLRAAYIVVPPGLIDPFHAAVRTTGQTTPMFVQVALHDFIENGYYRSHVRKMHRLYEARQAAFLKAIGAHLDDFLEVKAGQAGMQLVAFYRDGRHRARVEEHAARHGINVRCLSNYYLGTPGRPGLFLGYAAVAERQMVSSVRRLGKALKDCDHPTGISRSKYP